MSEKPQLPFGWIVKQSKSYPDRVYYFNINTGASTWEFPDLIKAYNVNPAGPVSPPVLSATSFKRGPGTPIVQSPPKQLPEPTFSPQFSDSDNDGSQTGYSPAQYKLHSERPNHLMRVTPQQKYGSDYLSTQTPNVLRYGGAKVTGTAVKEKRSLLGPYPGVTLPKSHQLGIGSQRTPNYSQYGTDKLRDSTCVKKPGLSGPCPPGSNSKFAQVYGTPKTTYVKGQDDLSKASTSKSCDKNCSKKSSESDMVLKHDAKAGSSSSTDAYNKAIKILSKSVEKNVKTLEKLVHSPGTNTDIINSSSNLSQKKALTTRSGNERKSLEKDINDNVKSSGKKRQLDQDTVNSFKKDALKTRLDKSIEVVVPSDAVGHNKTIKHLMSPVKKGEPKSVKRKASEVFQQDRKTFNIDDTSDRRKVVKSAVTQDTSRNVMIKDTPVKFGTNSTVSEDLKVQTSVERDYSQNALGSSKSFTREASEDSNLSLELPEDPDQSGILRQFIGDKDKLLSIQSWIDNLHEGGGSSSGSVASFPESFSGDADDKRVVISDKSTDCDSGYLSPPLKPGTKTERGWPGEIKKSNMTSREITAMEVDDIELPESDIKFQEEDMVIDLMLSEVREQMKSNPEKVCGTLTATVAELQEFMKEQETLGKLKFSKEITPQNQEITPPSLKQLYIVIDTNVIISDLPFIRDLKDQEIAGYGKPILFIPWIVLQELDSLKVANTKGMPRLTAATQSKAIRGIKMLQHMFREKHPQIKGQTPIESQDAARAFKAECNDDIILMTCLQHRKNNSLAEVVLLTNDNNLINKALVCGVNAYNRKDFHSGLQKLKQSGTVVTPEKFIPIPRAVHFSPTGARQPGQGHSLCKPIPIPSTSRGSQSVAQNMLNEEKTYTVEKLAGDVHCKLKDLLKAGLGKVLQIEMELAYSDIWEKIVLRKPPWSLKDILDSVKKHWIAVFGLVFPRSLVKQIEFLSDKFKEEKEYHLDDLAACCNEASIFLEHCVRRNLYGSAMIDVKENVQHLQNLCDSVSKGNTNVQSISSLEIYLKNQLSSQPQRNCDNQGENTYLVSPHSNKTNGTNKSVSPQSGFKNNNPSQPHTSDKNDNSVPLSPASKCLSQPVQGPVPWELAARKLQKIWQHIYSCCDEMRKLLSSGMGETVLSAVEKTLSLLVPAAKEIRSEYVVVLQLPLSHLPGHMDKIGRLANQCNNFFCCLQISDDDPLVDAESFLALFRNGQQRECLNMFLTQLDEMLCHLYKCLHHLDPGD